MNLLTSTTFAWLAQADPAAPAAPEKFTLFWHPLPVWDYWYLLVIPLCAGISIVYKAIKVRNVNQVPREAGTIFAFIIASMVLAAVALYKFVDFTQRK